MTAPSWTDEHARAVRRAAPSVDDADHHEIDRVWALVEAAVDRTPQRRKRRGRTVLTAAVLGVALATGGVAAADVFSAHTGRYVTDAEDLRLGGPGESLDPSAPDYADVVEAITGDVLFPDEQARELALVEQVRLDTRFADGGSYTRTGLVRFTAARAAVCAWSNAWVAAAEAGDGVAEERAAGMLVAAPDWDPVRELDAEQWLRVERIRVEDPETGQVRTQRVLDGTPAGYFPLVRDAVRADDVAEVADVLRTWGVCDPDLVVDFPQALARD